MKPSDFLVLLGGVAQIAQAKEVSYVDTFDAKPLIVTTPEPINDVNSTAGGALSYNAFAYDNLDLLPVKVGLKADTKPQVIGSGLTGQVFKGERGWKPMNSSIVCYDEVSIAYACIVYSGIGEPIGSTINCTMRVESTKMGTTNTAVQDLVYTPALLQPTMAKVDFGQNFKCVNETIVTLTKAPVPLSLVVILFDTHAYNAYYK